MMNKALIAAAASLAIGGIFAAPLAHAEVIGFTGAYDLANWITDFTGTPAGGGGASTSHSATTLTLSGGNSDPVGCTSGPCVVMRSIVVPGPDQHLRFHWDYTSNDIDGPGFDNFGFSINGILTQLSDPGSGQSQQSGDAVVSLAAGSTFGWYIDCTDCTFGNASVTITDFAAVPEPGSLALLGLGLAGLAGLRRRRFA